MFDVQDLQQTAGPTESSSSPRQSSSGQQVHLLDRLTAVFRHRRIAGAAFVIVVGLMMLQTYSKIPLYRASARVEIQDERTTAVGNLNSNDPMFYQDPGAVLQHAVQHPAQPRTGQARRAAAAAAEPPALQRQRAADPRAAQRGARGATGDWHFRAQCLSRGKPEAPAEKPAPDESAVESSLISQFLGGVEIIPEKSTRLVEIVYTSSSPEFAALAATTLAEEYAQQNIDLRLETINKNLVWLTDEVAKQEKKVTEAEAAMSSYREQQNALSLEDRQNIVVSRLNTLNDTATRARTTRLQKEASYNQVKSVDPKSDAADAYPVISTNPGVMEAKTRLNDLTAEKARLSSRYLPGHPDLIKVEGQIDSARAALVAQRTRVIESARNEYEAAVIEERSYAGQLESQKGAAMDLDRKSGGYLVLQRQAETNRAGLPVAAAAAEGTAGRQQQPHEQRAGHGSRRGARGAVLAQRASRLVHRAHGGTARRARPRVRHRVPRRHGQDARRCDGSAAAAAAGPGAVGARQARAAALRGRAARLRRGLPVAAHIARLYERIGGTARDRRHEQPAARRARPRPPATSAWCWRSAARACCSSTPTCAGRACTPSSARRTRLACRTCSSGRRACATPCRKRASRTCSSSPPGRIPPNPSELLSSERMSALLANLRSGPFDWVIIDTPPVLAVTDAVIVARAVSGVVFVIGSEMTRRVHAERAIETLSGGKTEVDRRGPQPRRLRPQPLLLLALLRLPLPELLRHQRQEICLTWAVSANACR